MEGFLSDQEGEGRGEVTQGWKNFFCTSGLIRPLLVNRHTGRQRSKICTPRAPVRAKKIWVSLISGGKAMAVVVL